jgi:K+/H+ antiporter YhaU regulatory subunit KhtT
MDIQETTLPGVGLRHEFSTQRGHQVGVVSYRTGVSIVAVLRGQTAFPAPEPSFAFQAGDTAVVVGTSAGVRALTTLLDG